MRNASKFSIILLTAAFAICAPLSFGQVAGLGLNPARTEVELDPGQEKTISFEIDAPASEKAVRGQLLLSLADWDISREGAISYSDPQTLPQSASSWTVFSPSAVTILSGQTQRVRVTLRVPKDAKPGVYRSAVMVQERPPATPPKLGEHFVYLRFRYVFTIYAIVKPVEASAEFLSVRFTRSGAAPVLKFELKNTGNRHVRPLITWSIQSVGGKPISSGTRFEAMVLLPGKTLDQVVPIGALPPGNYEVYTEVNFQDGHAIQMMRQMIHVSLGPGVDTD